MDSSSRLYRHGCARVALGEGQRRSPWRRRISSWRWISQRPSSMLRYFTSRRVAERRRLSRKVFLLFFAQMPAATVVMEACGSAHFWARKIEDLGHRVVLLPPHQVRPYVTRNKTDRTDAKGILEAYRNADIR